MPASTHGSGDLRLCVVLTEAQARLCAAHNLLSFAPQADMRIGAALSSASDQIAGLVQRAEAQFVGQPGLAAEPVATRPLEAARIEADLILDLRPGPPDPALAVMARYGLWSPAPFDTAAVLRGEPSAPVRLIGLTADGVRGLVAEACVQTKWLPAHTEAFALEKTVQLFRREWMRLNRTGRPPTLAPMPAGRPPATRLSHVLRHGAALGRELIGRRLRALGYRPRHGVFALRLGHGAPGPVDIAARDIPMPHKGLRADPFLFEHDGELYCFYEDFPEGTTEARIAVARVDADGMRDLGTVLDTGYHLSFPHVFAYGGAVYMMPETLFKNRVEIWRATDFPMKWELHATALEGRQFADPVVFEHQGQWWFMASPCHDSFGDFSSELWLFRTDGPFLSKLEPHPLNPIVVGSDVARGGGRVLAHEGRLYRMAQDNSGPVYGYGLKMMEITTLTGDDYAEHCVYHLRGPDIPGAIGCHHIDFAGGRFVADVRWS